MSNYMDVLFKHSLEEYLKFGEYFFRGFNDYDSLKKYLENTYKNYHYIKRCEEELEKTGVDPRIQDMLNDYSKMKNREPLDRYKIIEKGLIKVSEMYELDEFIVYLMGYCYLMGVEEVPLIDTSRKYKQFRYRYYDKEDIESDCELCMYEDLKIYLNPKLYERLIYDERSNIHKTYKIYELMSDNILKTYSYEKSFNLIKSCIKINESYKIKINLQKNKKMKEFLHGDYYSNCPICLESNKDHQKMICRLTCNHIFHKECIDNIVKSNNRDSCRCPICRSRIIESNIDKFYIDLIL